MIALTDLLGAAEQMIAALIVNQANVVHRGNNIVEFISTGQGLVASAKVLNQEQEQLKSALKLKTEQLKATQKKLNDWQTEAVSSVKLSYRGEKPKWSEFGVTAKK